MDVTNGLLSNLVKTRAIQRVLAPIASQISLLIILNESDNGSQMSHEEMVPCAKTVMQASHKLITVAKQQAQTTSDEEFKVLTVSACEVLELSSSNLYIASERLKASNSSKEARSKLVQASKDVLQGTMKVLLVADDAEIRRLITATHIVIEKLGALGTCSDMTRLVHRFKEFTDALAVMTGLADRRQKDLIQSKQRERIITSLTILKKCISSLSVAMQNSVKYRHNPQAQIGKSYVVSEVQTALTNIVDAIQNLDTDEDDIDLEQPGKFVSCIDMALEAVTEDSRYDLNADIEMWTEEAIRHSMTVAHLCYDSHRDSIIHTCQQVIQEKGRVISLFKMIQNDAELSQVRDDYNQACENLTDEFCELEKIVNISLLHFVVDYFKETTEPLERLVKTAVYSDKHGPIHRDDETVTKFEDHAEKICQIAGLAAASSTDARRVHDIRLSVLRLERLDPEIIPAVISISNNPHDKTVMRHLKLLMKEWTFELNNVVKIMNEMTDPKMFMLVSERKIEDDINTCNGCMLIQDEHGFTVMLQSVVGRSRRVVQVAEGIVDANEDPLYRNGLMVFVLKLKKAIMGVRTAGENVICEFTHKPHQDLLRKRFTQLQDALIKLKSGLNDSNHPHVLSALRQNVRNKLTGYGERSFLAKKSKQVPVCSKSSRLPRQSGDHIIAATSVPKLNLESITRDDPITPHTATHLHSDIVRSKSASQITSVNPQSFSLKLWSDLLSWATKGDRDKVNQLCGDLLCWTNHIIDVTQTVLLYTEDHNKKREIESLCFEVDQMTSEMLEKAKVVLHGDFSQLNALKTQGNEWGSKVEQVRVYVDITVEQWKQLCDKSVDAAKLGRTESVKQQVKMIQGHVEYISELVSVTERLRWENQVKGQDKIEALWEDKKEVDNLTVTFKTTAEMVAEHGMRDDVPQLEQLGREWSVKIYSMVCMLDCLCLQLLDLGLQRRIWSRISAVDGLHETLQNENTKIKDLMKSSCYGDDSKKEQYKNYMGDMSECVEEIKALTLRKRSDIVMVPTHYKQIHAGLYRGVWILKAIQCVDLSRQQTSMYSGGIDVIIEKAFLLKAAVGDHKDDHRTEFNHMLEQFTNNVALMKKKILQGIQLSSELGKRSVVRQCLDTVNQLAPQVVIVMRELADGTSTGHHGSVLWHRLLWCAKLYHLMECLGQMTDIKSTLVQEISNLLQCGECSIGDDAILDKLTCLDSMDMIEPPTSVVEQNNTSSIPGICTSQQVVTEPRSVPSGIRSRIPLSTNTNVDNIPSSSDHGKQNLSYSSVHNKPVNFAKVPSDSVRDVENFDPVTVDLDAIEEQLIQNTESLNLSLERDPGNIERRRNQSDDWMTKTTTATTTAKPPSASKPVMELFKEAQFIQRQADQWEDDSNPSVKVAKTMATQVQQMTQYVRQQGPIQNHLALVQTAKAVAENSDKVLHFAQILVKHCLDKSFSEDLRSYCLQVPLVRQQLLILANVQLGTAQSDTADRILVQNAQNLMRKILQMMTACEAVSMKGLCETVDEGSDDSILLATRWRQRYVAHRQQGVASSDCDELGLRIVEGDDQPPTLTQIFQTSS